MPAALKKESTGNAINNRAKINQAGPEQGNFSGDIFVFLYFFSYLFNPLKNYFFLICGIVKSDVN